LRFTDSIPPFGEVSSAFGEADNFAHFNAEIGLIQVKTLKAIVFSGKK
jgi:hypothetical protein